ncbi:MAG: hypothetical protein OHK0036_15670 [Bacteroidia bacterium]
MKNFYHIILLSGCILSCTENTSNNTNADLQDTSYTNNDTIINSPNTDSISNQNKIIFQQIDNNALIVITGTEPGWILNLFENKFQFIGNYGKDTLEKTIKLDLKNLPIQYQSKEISFNIEKKQCIAISGDTLPLSARVTYQQNNLQGCGKFLK